MPRVIYAITRYSIPSYLRKRLLEELGADRIVYVKVPFIKSTLSTEEKIKKFTEFMQKRMREDDVPVAVIVSRAPLMTMLAVVWAIRNGIPVVVTHNDASRPDDVLESIFKKKFTYTIFTPDVFNNTEHKELVENVQ